MINFILLDIANGWKTAIMLVAMGLVFYFFIIRPQSQEQKKEAQYRDSLKKGDRVMTAGGIHGTIFSTEKSHIHLEIAPGKTIRVQKTAIQPIPTPKEKK